MKKLKDVITVIGRSDVKLTTLEHLKRILPVLAEKMDHKTELLSKEIDLNTIFVIQVIKDLDDLWIVNNVLQLEEQFIKNDIPIMTHYEIMTL